MNEVRGYRVGIPALSLATIFCAVFLFFTALRTDGSRVYFEPIPTCIFRGGIRMGELADFIMNCPDDFRLAMMAFLGALTILMITIAGLKLVIRSTLEHTVRLSLTRVGLAAITVGIGYLIGVYVSEFVGGQGTVNFVYVVGLPLLTTLMHFPRKAGFLIAVPVTMLGFLSMVVICFVTGIPLD